jgi:hypothetical protein
MKRNVIIAIVAAGAVVGGGTLIGAALGSDDERTAAMSTELDDVTVADANADTTGSNDTTDGTNAGTDDSPDDGADDGAARSAAERAVNTAINAVPGVVTETELDDDGRPRGWEIEIYGEDGQWHTVRISEDGTETLDSRARPAGDDGDDDGDDDSGDDDRVDVTSLLSDSAVVDAAAAIRLAEEHTSATLREASVDDGHWELELRGDDGGHELRINLASGDISDEERDDDGRDEDGDEGDDRDGRDDDRDDDRGEDRNDDRGDDNADDR